MRANKLQLPAKLDDLRDILSKHGVIFASVFGSYARGEAKHDSDLDLLVTLDNSSSLYNLIDLQTELEAITSCRVDVATKLHPRFEAYISPDLVTIL